MCLFSRNPCIDRSAVCKRELSEGFSVCDTQESWLLSDWRDLNLWKVVGCVWLEYFIDWSVIFERIFQPICLALLCSRSHNMTSRGLRDCLEGISKSQLHSSGSAHCRCHWRSLIFRATALTNVALLVKHYKKHAKAKWVTLDSVKGHLIPYRQDNS